MTKNMFGDGFFLVSHRGASRCEPENTLRSFRRAVDMGSRAIEFDVRRSLDGRAVVIHDRRVDRTTDGKGTVSGKTLAELRSLDAGEGERIPALEEVFDAFAGKCGLVVELKEPGAEEETLRLVEKYGVARQVAVVSFRKDCLRRVKEMRGDVATGLITVFGAGCVRAALSLGCRIVATNHRFMTRALAARARRSGLSVFCWTVDDRRRCERLRDMGVNGVITNRPDLLGEPSDDR